VRRSEETRLSSPNDDELGGNQARSALSELSERSNQNWIARRSLLGTARRRKCGLIRQHQAHRFVCVIGDPEGLEVGG
jgi:hypothetical protein